MKKEAEEQAQQLVVEAGLSSAEAAATVVSECGRGLTVDIDRYRFAQDYVHATNPETGPLVVFVPGELLPEWAAAAQAGRTSAVLASLNLLGPGDARRRKASGPSRPQGGFSLVPPLRPPAPRTARPAVPVVHDTAIGGPCLPLTSASYQVPPLPQ